jgi:hypothetical protein
MRSEVTTCDSDAGLAVLAAERLYQSVYIGSHAGEPTTLAIAGGTTASHYSTTEYSGRLLLRRCIFDKSHRVHSEDPNILYGYNNQSGSYDLIRFTASPSGVSGTLVANNLIQTAVTSSTSTACSTPFTARREPEHVSLLGTFQGGGSGMAVDIARTGSSSSVEIHFLLLI